MFFFNITFHITYGKNMTWGCFAKNIHLRTRTLRARSLEKKIRIFIQTNGLVSAAYTMAQQLVFSARCKYIRKNEIKKFKHK